MTRNSSSALSENFRPFFIKLLCGFHDVHTVIGNPLKITDTVEHDGNTVTVMNGKILLVQFYKIGSKLILITVYLFLCFFTRAFPSTLKFFRRSRAVNRVL